jgi:hypothetical protein
MYGPVKTQGLTASGVILSITGDFYANLTDAASDESAVVSSFGVTGSTITGLSGPVYYPAEGRTH